MMKRNYSVQVISTNNSTIATNKFNAAEQNNEGGLPELSPRLSSKFSSLKTSSVKRANEA